MRILQGVLARPLTDKDRIKESRAALRTIRTARLVDRSLASSISKLPASEIPYNFAIRRRLGGIGDVIMSTVALRGLKEKFPKCKITYVTNYGLCNACLHDILIGNPYVDEIISCKDFVESKFDHWSDITEIDIMIETSAGRPIERIDIYCNYLGVIPSSKVPVYIVAEEEKEWAENLLSEKFGIRGKRVFINPASNADRRNAPLPIIAQVIKRLADEGYHVVMSHHFDKLPEFTHKNFLKNFDGIRKAAALMNACDILVMHDTGLLHIAGALQKKIVGLFGSISPEARISHYEKRYVIFNKEVCEFAPCLYKGCQKKFLCMNSITSQQILTGIKSLENNTYKLS